MTKPNLVLLPGSLCDRRLFEAQIGAFNNAFSIEVVDLSAYESIDKMAEATLSRVDGKFTLLGLSMGGITALRVVQLAPERVAKLALLSTNPFTSSAEQIAGRMQQLEHTKSRGISAVEEIVSGIAPLYFPNNVDNSGNIELVMDMAMASGVAGFTNQWHAINTRDNLFSSLKNIHQKTIIIGGENDVLCPPDMQRTMAAEIRNSELHILPNCGHLSTIEQPDLVNSKLQSFLKPESN